MSQRDALANLLSTLDVQSSISICCADWASTPAHLWCCRAKYPGSKVECGPALDLTSQASVKAFAQAILKRPGGLHILVNNAGLGYTKKSFTEEGVGMLTQVLQ
jgi:NAD(P)-dependent dehydrogenase (short-subunit alcohol dehydrogenase family)